VSVVLELTEDCFHHDGSLDLGFIPEAGIRSQRPLLGWLQDIYCRTDFVSFVEAAERLVHGCGASSHDHMTAPQDPYVFSCPDCTIFRGERAAGYPFLETPVSANVIACAMECAKPAVLTTRDEMTDEKLDWYASDTHQASLVERLALIATVAMQTAKCDAKPILVLSPLGCIDKSNRHPWHAVAHALKHWRNAFAGYFHTVILACGSNSELAAHLDIGINRDVYATLVSHNFAPFASWHWNSQFLAMHRNFRDMNDIAAMVANGRTYACLADSNQDCANTETLATQRGTNRHCLLNSMVAGLAEHHRRERKLTENEALITEIHMDAHRMSRLASRCPSRQTSRASSPSVFHDEVRSEVSTRSLSTNEAHRVSMGDVMEARLNSKTVSVAHAAQRKVAACSSSVNGSVIESEDFVGNCDCLSDRSDSRLVSLIQDKYRIATVRKGGRLKPRIHKSPQTTETGQAADTAVEIRKRTRNRLKSRQPEDGWSSCAPSAALSLQGSEATSAAVTARASRTASKSSPNGGAEATTAGFGEAVPGPELLTKAVERLKQSAELPKLGSAAAAQHTVTAKELQIQHELDQLADTFQKQQAIASARRPHSARPTKYMEKGVLSDRPHSARPIKYMEKGILSDRFRTTFSDLQRLQQKLPRPPSAPSKSGMAQRERKLELFVPSRNDNSA